LINALIINFCDNAWIINSFYFGYRSPIRSDYETTLSIRSDMNILVPKSERIRICTPLVDTWRNCKFIHFQMHIRIFRRSKLTTYIFVSLDYTTKLHSDQTFKLVSQINSAKFCQEIMNLVSICKTLALHFSYQTRNSLHVLTLLLRWQRDSILPIALPGNFRNFKFTRYTACRVR
jgi:hypothetical protein